MLQYVQSFVQPLIVSLELGGSWGPVMSSLPRLLSPGGRSPDRSGSYFEGDKGLCLCTRCNLCKVMFAGFAPRSVFPSHADVWLYLLSPWLLLVSAPPLVKKGGKGEKLVQSFQSPERRAGAKLFQAVQYLGHHAITPTRAKMLLSCRMPKLHTRSPLTKTTLVSVIN